MFSLSTHVMSCDTHSEPGLPMLLHGKQGGFEVKLEKRPTMNSCDRASNNINQSQTLFVDM